MSDLDSATTPRRVDTSRFIADIGEGWLQGRGAFGGLVLAHLVRAIEQAAGGPERHLRTLTAELCGAVQPGTADVLVEALRTGSGTSTIAARLSQAGEVRAHAVAVLGRDRAGDADQLGLTPPVMPDWRSVAELEVSTLPPVFARHFEYRPTGPSVFGGGAHAGTSGFVRARDPGPRRDAGYLVALADAWWPALFTALSVPRPMATVTFTLQIAGDCEGLDADAPLYHDGWAMVTRHGYSTEQRLLWGSDGRLLALNQQTLVVIV